MEQFVNSLLDNCNLPVLTAFLLGILTSVSPCTFTTNVMVLGYIGRDMSGGRRVFANGLFYTLGRIVSYTVLGLICIPVLKKGASTFFVQSLVSDYGGYILAPTLIVYGVFLLLGSKFPFGKFGFRASESSKRCGAVSERSCWGCCSRWPFVPSAAYFISVCCCRWRRWSREATSIRLYSPWPREFWWCSSPGS